MIQHTQLIDRAKSLGITVTDVSEFMQRHAAILEYNGISELIMDGIPTSWINVRGEFYGDNKQLTKYAYKALNIPHPESITFLTPDDPGVQAFLKKGKVYVCKPLVSENGIGVRMNIESLEMINAYFKEYGHLSELFILEEQITGTDLRMHLIEGKIVAACIREPAFVVGNGRDTLAVLMEKRRAVMKTQNPKNFLEVDDATKELLAQQQLRLSDIPPEGRKIQLKYVSNIAQGGVATDVTEAIHPVYQEWATALSDYLKTGYMALDFITTDYTAHPASCSYILEINALGHWYHHTFTARRTHDMAGMILKNVFKL